MTPRQESILRFINVSDSLSRREIATLLDSYLANPDFRLCWELYKLETFGSNPFDPSQVQLGIACKIIRQFQQDPEFYREKVNRYHQSIPATPRQTMLLAFFGLASLRCSYNTSLWITRYFEDDPYRRLMWQLWKMENPEANASNDPLQVPTGIADSFAARFIDDHCLYAMLLIDQTIKLGVSKNVGERQLQNADDLGDLKLLKTWPFRKIVTPNIETLLKRKLLPYRARSEGPLYTEIFRLDPLQLEELLSLQTKEDFESYIGQKDKSQAIDHYAKPLSLEEIQSRVVSEKGPREIFTDEETNSKPTYHDGEKRAMREYLAERTRTRKNGLTPTKENTAPSTKTSKE